MTKLLQMRNYSTDQPNKFQGTTKKVFKPNIFVVKNFDNEKTPNRNRIQHFLPVNIQDKYFEGRIKRSILVIYFSFLLSFFF